MKLAFNVAIDGEAGTGKSTVAKLVATKLGLTYINSGSLYRIIGIKCKALLNTDKIDEALIQTSKAKINSHFEKISIDFDNEDGTFYVHGEPKIINLTSDDSFGKLAALFAGHQFIRDIANKYLIKLGKERLGILMEGRDIGSIVMPLSKFKFYLVADPETKAKRRFEQMKKQGLDVDLNRLIKEMSERDNADRNRKVAPAIKPKDAVLIDTNKLSIEQVVSEICNLISLNSK